MKPLLLVLFSVLLIGCFWASFDIPLWVEWASLKSSPWFLVTLMDLYIGLILFALFTYLVKKNIKHSFIWAALFFSLGNMATIVWIVMNKKELYAKFK
jgi:hypothetical protein